MSTIIARDPKVSYSGDKGFGPHPPARLARLVLAYGALAVDPATPGALRDYAAAALGDLRGLLAARRGGA